MSNIDYISALKLFDDYITDHLDQDNLLDRGIGASYVSKYHFYRLFKAVTGMTVNGYIIERRLLNIMGELMGDKRVIDIALDNGFKSNEVMTRNFKRVFGLTPAKFRKLSVDEQIKLFRKKTIAKKLDFGSLELKIKNNQGLLNVQDFEVNIKAMDLIGVSRNSDDSMVATIPEFVNQVAHSLGPLENIEEALYRICHSVDNSKGIPSFVEFVGIPVKEGSPIPEGLELFNLESCKVLKFIHKGQLYSEEKTPVVKTYELIYKYRLPALKVLPTDQYYIERYGNDFLGVFNPNSVVTIMMTISSMDLL